MLLTNNQKNTMRQYSGELPGMTHVQSKPEKKTGNSIDCLSHPLFKIQSVQKETQTF